MFASVLSEALCIGLFLLAHEAKRKSLLLWLSARFWHDDPGSRDEPVEKRPSSSCQSWQQSCLWQHVCFGQSKHLGTFSSSSFFSLDYRMIYSALLFCASQQKWRITWKWEAGSCKNSFLFFSKLVAGRLVTILCTIWLQVNLSQISVAQKPPSIWRSERIWASVGQESIPWIMAPFYQPPLFWQAQARKCLSCLG